MKINAVIENKDGGTLVLDFPHSIYDVYEKLQSVRINTDICEDCADYACITACPEKILCIEEDDFENEIASVKEDSRNSLKFICAACKGSAGSGCEPPCIKACSKKAIDHSW